MATPIPKPPQKPVAVPKPGLFAGSRPVSIIDTLRKVPKETVIPGTGGQKIYKGAHRGLLQKYLPPGKVNTFLSPEEKRTILRKMRSEDKGNPSRDGRILEEDFGLKEARRDY